MPALAAADVGKRSVTNDLPVVLAVDARSCDAAISGVVDDIVPAVKGGGAVGLRDLCSIGAAAGVNAWGLFGLLPAYETFGVSRSVAREVDGFGRLAGAAGVDTNRVAAFHAAAGTANCEVDPFLSLIDIWDAGPLGEMQRRANLVRSRGDAAAFDDAAAGYWQAMNTAVERREAFGGRGKRARAPVGQ